MSQFIPGATGVNFNSNAGAPDVSPSATALASFRTSLSAFVTFAASASAADIATGLVALIASCPGAHPQAIAQLWTAVATARGGDAATARTQIGTANTTANTAPNPPPAGVQF